MAVLALGAVGVSAALLWEIAVAGERLRGHARHVAEAVGWEGYGLHHWLHEERVAGTVTVLASRTLTAAEAGRLADHSATARWRRSVGDATRPVLPRGWEIVHLVGTAGDLTDGVLVLRPSDEIVSLATWDATRQALDITLGTAAEDAETLAGLALAASPLDNYDDARDLAFLASRFAGLDTDAVLRQVHAGHPRQSMTRRIEMGGNDLDQVAALDGERGAFPVIDGDCPPSPPGALSGLLCADSLDLGDGLTAIARATLSAASAEDVTIALDVSQIARVRAGDVSVSGTVTAEEMAACANPDADLCGGGDLDLVAGTGTPHWTEASIFGDTVIRNGSQLTGVTQAFVGTGVFGTIGNGPLTVTDCVRTVSPFIHHGAGC